MNKVAELRVRVQNVQQVAEHIKRFRLVPVDTDRLPGFSGGAHITVLLEHQDRLIRNPYSLMSSPLNCEAYEITVLRVKDSRGGSDFLHTRVSPGTELRITPPGNLFPVHQLARKHILLAGGIGITPFMTMAAQLAEQGRAFQIHYAVRTAASGAYTSALQERYGDLVTVYRDDLGQTVPLDRLLEGQPLGTHLYVCGPEGMINGALAKAQAAGWPDEDLHCERFLAPPAGEPFDVRLARSGLQVRVGTHESILEAVEAAGLEPPYLCRGGACGQCETRVLHHDGVLEHHDHYLTEQERRDNKALLICMSRFRGNELTLDL